MPRTRRRRARSSLALLRALVERLHGETFWRAILGQIAIEDPGRLAAAEAENARLRGGPAPGAQAVAEAPALAVKLRRRARG